MADRGLWPRALAEPRFDGGCSARRGGGGRQPARHCRGKVARTRLARREPARISAAADWPVFRPWFALPGPRTDGCGRHSGRCRDRLRHRRAPFDPRLPAGDRASDPPPPLPPAARYRRRNRHSGDRRRETAAPPGHRARHRSGFGRGREAQRRGQPCGQVCRDPRCGGLPRARASPARLRPCAVEHSGAAAGHTRTRSRPEDRTGRACSLIRAVASAGTDRSRPPPASRLGAGASDRPRRLVDLDPSRAAGARHEEGGRSPHLSFCQAGRCRARLGCRVAAGAATRSGGGSS